MTHSLTQPSTNRWIIALTVMLGAFMAVMDVSVVNVALPHMMGSFGVGQSEITWVATSYSIAEIIMVTMSGWWSALLGRKRLYLWSFALFTVGSILCGMAQNFAQMMVFRTLQGIGGGTLIPVSQAIMRESFPEEEQGTAMAVYGMGVVLAPAIGPILGGWLTDQHGWPWIFYINVPVAALGMLLIAQFVQDPPYLRRGVFGIDWTGIVLLTVGLTVVQLVFERGQQENWFESNLIVLGTIVGISALTALVFWELRVAYPIVNFRLLKNIPLSVGSAMGLIFGVALFGTTFILPQFTQTLLGYPAFDAGLVLLPRAITLFLIMPIVGRLYGKVDSRLLIFIGIGFIIWSYCDLAQLSLSAGFWTLVPILLIMGAGMPMMFVTMSTLSLSQMPPEDMTEASSLFTLARRVGGNLGYTLVATLVAHGSQLHRNELVAHISDLNPVYGSYHNSLVSMLTSRGVTHAAAENTAVAIANAALDRQATMLAYNDVSWVFAGLFIVAAPLIFLVPRAKKKAPPVAKNEEASPAEQASPATV